MSWTFLGKVFFPLLLLHLQYKGLGIVCAQVAGFHLVQPLFCPNTMRARGKLGDWFQLT